ncbi:hypothetical protein [Pseudoduganella albidiflava]|uniref:DUF2721 domain-containing protein n=1 Tax=Pseudoduganella albidiflava TaxID=321983 RepID=A0A411WWS4_9BURK|nr:hypothetical protein [Pseudoduganella albidiflava]QBI01205.1 hypothetical protein EYF70_10415 [Pseudoduganella albidiflava]GGY48976.1 hypothetical protein GCM10007387_34070 [Pseudoduganella albidiflava]
MELVKLEDLPSLLEVIRTMLSTALGSLVLGIVIFIYLVIKVPQVPLVQTLIGRKESRLKYLTESIACAADEPFCRTVVQDIRDAMIFEKATGIYAESKWRRGLVEMRDVTGVSWIIMRRARQYMDMNANGVLYIREFSLADRFEYRFNIMVMWIFLCSAVVSFLGALLLKLGLEITVASILVAILLVGSAMWAATQNWPQEAASNIRDRLNADGAATTVTS